jgi:hypothetical protein
MQGVVVEGRMQTTDCPEQKTVPQDREGNRSEGV